MLVLETKPLQDLQKSASALNHRATSSPTSYFLLVQCCCPESETVEEPERIYLFMLCIFLNQLQLSIEEASSGYPILTKASFFLPRSILLVSVNVSVSLFCVLHQQQSCIWKETHTYNLNLLHSRPSAHVLGCLQAYSAAVQSQLQWMKQLCLCVEQHVKENAAYFQV